MSLSHSKIASTVTHQHPSAVLHSCNASHKAAFDAGEVEHLVILVVVILGAEVFIPVAGHILLEESYKVFEKFKAVQNQQIGAIPRVGCRLCFQHPLMLTLHLPFQKRKAI